MCVCLPVCDPCVCVCVVVDKTCVARCGKTQEVESGPFFSQVKILTFYRVIIFVIVFCHTPPSSEQKIEN